MFPEVQREIAPKLMKGSCQKHSEGGTTPAKVVNIYANPNKIGWKIVRYQDIVDVEIDFIKIRYKHLFENRYIIDTYILMDWIGLNIDVLAQ